MCEDRTKGAKWTRLVIGGRKTIQDAADEFGMTIDEVNEHIDQHEYIPSEEKSIHESRDFYIRELAKILVIAQDWLDHMMDLDQVDNGTMTTGLKLMGEIRKTVQSIAEFQGRLDKGSSHAAKMAQMEENWMNLTSAMLTEVCPECQVAISKIIQDARRKE